MPARTDIRAVSASLYLLPVQTRLPLKFGAEVLTSVTCARVRLTITSRDGRHADGWGETPLSVQWVWPSSVTYQERYDAVVEFAASLCSAWADFPDEGHPLEVGHAFQQRVLPRLLARFNAERTARGVEPMPYLAALVCCSPFDIALHDAFGVLHGVPTYRTYNADYMNHDLSAFLAPDIGGPSSFAGKYPQDFLLPARQEILPAWHLVGGRDWLDDSDVDAPVPGDGEPYLLRQWIRRDGLKCLKVKLTGTDAAWDDQRLRAVGRIAIEEGAAWLSADFNCTVRDVGYVNDILDRLNRDEPRIHGMILYVEQPFPYELEEHPIDVHSLSARKPLFMDESAHHWQLVQFGRSLGWTGVALKTCKTQTGALLSLCWAKAHGMAIMVQDLTNPMLAQIPHLLLAAHAGTIMGVETNSMQFYPAASAAEAAVHPGLYARRNGTVDLQTISGPGFGYRQERISRTLPQAYA
jgi:L-alanine-DL-glutamate epimerase-like enolase superfamily enzyme